MGIVVPAVDLGALCHASRAPSWDCTVSSTSWSTCPPSWTTPTGQRSAPSASSIAFEHVSFRVRRPAGPARRFLAGPGAAPSPPSSARRVRARPPSCHSSRASTSPTRVASSPTAPTSARYAWRRHGSRSRSSFQESVLSATRSRRTSGFGHLPASEEDVRRAAEQALADDFIRALPDGYATRLGRAGAKLSVGQKQRLQVARALVRPAAVLILDEPTAALDPETEAALVRALRAASRERIVFVVTHRLSTVIEADQILFLEDGRIVERGRHADLVARPDGAYRRFWDVQVRGRVASASGTLPSAM